MTSVIQTPFEGIESQGKVTMPYEAQLLAPTICTPRYLTSVDHGRNAPETEHRR